MSTMKGVLFTLVILLPAAAKAVIGIWVWEPSDVTNRAWHLTPSVGRVIAAIVVERANPFPILSSVTCFSMNRNLCVTVAKRRPGTNLSAGFLISRVTHKDHVFTALSSTWSRASSAGSSCRYVERQPAQAVCRVLIMTRREVVQRQMAILVEHGETTVLTSFGQRACISATWN